MHCCSDGVPKRSLIVAAIVGTILNLINQGDAIVGDAPVNVTKLLLTFAVPYCVATYGAVLSAFETANMNSCCPPTPGHSLRGGHVVHSVIKCPLCGLAKTEQMPVDACQIVYECTGCGVVLRPQPGDCCV